MKLIPALLIWAALLSAQSGDLVQQANRLDTEGKGAAARDLFQKAIDTAETPATKARAQRAMAMSYAFEGNCKETVRYEQMVIDYWATREKDEPKNAFFQQGEMATEAARVCIDNGELDIAEQWYKKGRDLGQKEPEITADRKALWEYRWQHAAARVAARRGKRKEADEHIAAARAALDQMTDLKKAQEVFFPYLLGYVALYLGDYPKAVTELEKANVRDPFIQCLLGDAHEKLGHKEKAAEYYKQASTTNAHNPPGAYARRVTRNKQL